jgi:DNA-binding NtrC family response regulator
MSHLSDTSPERDELTLSLRPFHLPQSGPRLGERCYLLVVEGSTSYPFDLPESGEVIIGRSQDAHLRLEDSSASRRHARLLITSRDVVLMDLGSHNGTRVGGERLGGPRALTSGDVIQICSVTLIFHRDARVAAGRPVLALSHLRERLEEETDRALRYGRPLSLLCVHLLGASGDRLHMEITRALAGQLRLIDVTAWDGPAQVLVLLPELDEEDVADTAARLTRALLPLCERVRIGCATCPGDGADADTLLAGARAAALLDTKPGRPAQAAEAATTLTLGDRRIVVADPAMARLYALIEKLAQSDIPVLVSGETGAGKELAAAAVHHFSPRRDRPFLTLNCAALPESLVESELFGHERGAFSGALNQKLGLFEAAASGTVFLDEVGELPLATQAKLLRVLETHRITRVGDVRERPVDIRVVAATNRDLQKEVEAGRFRKDLLFRLNAARVTLPPLRDRRRELPVLARLLLTQACERLGRPPMAISAAAMQRLLSYPFPGNVRELKNIMDYMAATVQEGVLEPWDLSEHLSAAAPAGQGQGGQNGQGGQGGMAGEGAGTGPGSEVHPASQGPRRRFRPIEEELRELERTRMAEALEAAGGVQVRAAELISMPMRTFATKVKQYNLLPRTRKGAGP